MDMLEKKAELTALILHVAIFWKSGIPTYNSEVSDTTGKEQEEEHGLMQSVLRFTQT